MKKTQVLLVSFLLMLVAGLLSATILRMWGSALPLPGLQESSLAAFYLAQAGIARGKSMIIRDVGGRNNLISNACKCWPGPTKNDWSTGLDPAGDFATFNYRFEVSSLSGPRVTITGAGQVVDPSGKVVAEREAEVTVQGISDSVNNSTHHHPADGLDDNPADNGEVSNSWREI